MPSHFLSERTNLHNTLIQPASASVATSGEVILNVDRFALTANNITYGVAGDMIGYWQFFPTDDLVPGDNTQWGRIPVWGIGTVASSEHPDVAVGSRYYGYFPMSSELKVKPEKISERGFVDAAAHRSELPPVYNQYSLVTEQTGFAQGLDNHAMLYRPLFTTSFVLDDYLYDNNFFAANQIILGSASSKTAFGLAFLLAKRDNLKVVGLTSAGNVDFVNSLGIYDQVVTYDNVEDIEQQASAYVDMAGNRGVLARVHHHLAQQLLCSCGVGITHWDARDGNNVGELPGAKPEMFFAPSQIMKRQSELGTAVYQGNIAAATNDFFNAVDEWVKIEEFPFAEIESVYSTVLNGASPNIGYVVRGV